MDVMSLRASEDNYSIVGAQAVGIYPAPPQVSPAAVPVVEELA